MQVTFSRKKLRNNLDQIKSKHQNVSFLIKRQLLFSDISNELKNEVVYSTGAKGYVDIYNSDCCTIVDAFDRREGITIRQAEAVKDKQTAIVNFACCNGLVPKASDVNRIYDILKTQGWKKVSMGGSLLLWYDDIQADEIRVGEALLTGYSTIYNEYYLECSNPFEITLDMYGSNEDHYILNTGFQYLGGFTNCEPECVNTDFTIISKRYDIATHKEIMLQPDYYTLMKLAFNGLLK